MWGVSEYYIPQSTQIITLLPPPSMGFGSDCDSCSESGSDDSSCLGLCHTEHILQTLNTFRQSATFTDVVLKVEG
ncbi:hypothetical protein P4O66_000227 [Electrophorus voltai]|uniref:Uncharacterized protein n=1 Tax=Electrophorus voltai TaxID=2609070 RepID=A0AAD9DYF3_9TELE|nr:hypothetical protein P4O66_000227 [Electrophorus voltai]